MLQIGIMDCSPLSNPAFFSEKIKQVSPQRRDIVECHKTERGKRQSLGGGLLIQAMLEQAVQQRCAAPYHSFSWKKGEQGKPILLGVTDTKGEPLYVNLSHSGEMAAAVLADFEVGIDIQEQQTPPEGVARRFFTQQEQAWLYATEAMEKAEHFFRLWTLKEAYIKTTGQGMRTPLMDFDVTKAAEKCGEVIAITEKGWEAEKAEKIFLCALPTILQPTDPEQHYALAVGGKKLYETPETQCFLIQH